MSIEHPGRNADAIRMLVAEAAAEWYLLHREGEPAPRQREEFLRWLRASPLHVHEYLAISRLGGDLAEAARHIDTPVDALVAGALAEDGVVPLRHSRTPRTDPRAATPMHRTLAIAASLTLAFIGGIAGLLWLLPRDNLTIATRRGEQRTQELADGTVVHLNADTELAVDFGPAFRRVDVRRGQALFEVAKDARRPFSVRAGASAIEDIGTIFDVATTAANTTVTVVEGRVAIWNRTERERMAESGAVATLQPLADLGVGEQALIASNGSIDHIGGANLRKATAWTHQEIVFDHDPIATVAAEFNRYNHQQVRIDDPQIAAIRISGVLRAYDVRAFIDFLNGLPGVRAASDGQQIRVTALRTANR